MCSTHCVSFSLKSDNHISSLIALEEQLFLIHVLLIALRNTISLFFLLCCHNIMLFYGSDERIVE